MNWLKGQFALLQGQLVEIIRVPLISEICPKPLVQIKLVNDNLRHWVKPEQLQQLNAQIAPKVLYA